MMWVWINAGPTGTAQSPWPVLCIAGLGLVFILFSPACGQEGDDEDIVLENTAREESVSDIDPDEMRKLSLRWKKKEAVMKRQLKQKCKRRLAVYKKKRDLWNYARLSSNLQRFDVAVKYYQRILKKGRRSWHSNTGELHREMAKNLALMGRPQDALKYAGLARAKAESKWQQEQADMVLKLAESYGDMIKLVRGMLKRVDADLMDGEAVWDVCRMTYREVPYKMEEKVMLTRMYELFPDHKAVASGMVEYRLLENCWAFDEYAAVVELSEVLLEDYAEHWAVKEGSVRWHRAEANYHLGEFAKAFACYKELKREHPGHWSVTGVNGEEIKKKMRECLEKMDDLK